MEEDGTSQCNYLFSVTFLLFSLACTCKQLIYYKIFLLFVLFCTDDRDQETDCAETV